MVWTNLKLIQLEDYQGLDASRHCECILLKVLSYLTLKPVKLLHNPKKSFFSGCFHPFASSHM